eukprot:256744-Chlamydomonas_euryale.AAC.1
MQLASEDVRFDLPLADACRGDRNRLCANEPPGSAGVWRCLLRYRTKLEPRCSAVLFDEEIKVGKGPRKVVSKEGETSRWARDQRKIRYQGRLRIKEGNMSRWARDQRKIRYQGGLRIEEGNMSRWARDKKKIRYQGGLRIEEGNMSRWARARMGDQGAHLGRMRSQHTTVCKQQQDAGHITKSEAATEGA